MHNICIIILEKYEWTNMDLNERKKEILESKEKIHELKEYLSSCACKDCYDAILQLEKYQSKVKYLEDETVPLEPYSG